MDPLFREGPDGTVVLVDNWYSYHVAHGVRTDLPGLYEWQIAGVGIYIGKYRSITRPTREYALNVRRILNGRPYRKGKPDAFRAIHRALEEAVRRGRDISLTIIENVTVADINRRERELIAERGTLNGPFGGPART